MEKEITYTSMELPLGYIFQPHPRVLVEYYLLNKVTGKPLPSNNPVKDIDVYGDPKVWSKLFQSSRMKTLYFYTKLTKKKEKGKTVKRATEFGTWRTQNNIEVYDHSDEDDEDDEEGRDGFNQKEQRHIASMRSFTFVAKKGFFPSCRWTMHEYRLDGIYGNIANNDDYVVCQINKFKKFKRHRRDNSHQVEDVATYENVSPLYMDQVEDVATYENVSPLYMEYQDEDFEACYNSLSAYETPHLDF